MTHLPTFANFVLLYYTCALIFTFSSTEARNLRESTKNIRSGIGCAASNDKEEVDLLIVGGNIVTMDESSKRYIANGTIAVKDSIIVSIGPRSNVTKSYCSQTVVTAKEHDIVMPGLINGHTHAPMSLLRSIASDQLSLKDWLEGYIFPAEKVTVSPRFCRVGTQLAMLEMIMTGTTTFVDMYYFEEDIA